MDVAGSPHAEDVFLLFYDEAKDAVSAAVAARFAARLAAFAKHGTADWPQSPNVTNVTNGEGKWEFEIRVPDEASPPAGGGGGGGGGDGAQPRQPFLDPPRHTQPGPQRALKAHFLLIPVTLSFDVAQISY